VPATRCFILTIIMHIDVWGLVEMEHWSVQHWIVALELLFKTVLVTPIHSGFHQQSQRRDAPCCNTLLLWALKWCQEESVKDSTPQGHPLSAPATDNMQQVRDTMLRSLRRLAQWQALAFRLNKCSCQWILHKDLYYCPYKTQVAQEVSERDKVSRLQFCNEFLDVVRNNRNIVNTLQMSVEAHFNVSGYVNEQNCR